MSVEMEENAHKTLTLRALYRNLTGGSGIKHYSDYISGKIDKPEMQSTLSSEWAAASEETLFGPTKLGEDNAKIHARLHDLKKSKQGENWVVIGGPPCQAYSLVGRARNKGKKDYLPENDHRHYLYQEYLKVLDIIEPDVFVMENVRGILSSKVEGEKIFPIIINDLKNPRKTLKKRSKSRGREYQIYSFVCPPDRSDFFDFGYEDDRSYIIKSEYYGVPQTRHRVILLGVANDIDKEPTFLGKPGNADFIPVDRLLSGLPPLRSHISRREDDPEEWAMAIQTQAGKMRGELIKLGYKKVAEEVDKAQQKLRKNYPTSSSKYSKNKIDPKAPSDLQNWILADAPPLVLNHETRGHKESDLGRYLFSACWAKAKPEGRPLSPKAPDFPDCLAPDHANWRSGKFTDRFRVQVKGHVAKTITSHIKKDGHYFIHYDPTQCRSLTVREAARIQTFPDNYFFEGARTPQFEQVGNAVPPFLALKLAAIVYELIG